MVGAVGRVVDPSATIGRSEGDVDMNQRPLPVTIIGCLYIVMGARLRISPHRVQGAASISIRHHMGRTRPSHSDCVWSIHAARSQLGALACARLDRLPRDPERVPHAIRAGNSHSVLRNPGLFSLPPHRDPLLPGCQSIGEIAAFSPGYADLKSLTGVAFRHQGVRPSIAVPLDGVSGLERHASIQRRVGRRRETREKTFEQIHLLIGSHSWHDSGFLSVGATFATSDKNFPAIRFISNCSTVELPAAPREWQRSGSRYSLRMPSASASESSGSTRIPWGTTSGTAAAHAATIGFPAAIASRNTMPKPS